MRRGLIGTILEQVLTLAVILVAAYYVIGPLDMWLYCMAFVAAALVGAMRHSVALKRYHEDMALAEWDAIGIEEIAPLMKESIARGIVLAYVNGDCVWDDEVQEALDALKEHNGES